MNCIVWSSLIGLKGLKMPLSLLAKKAVCILEFDRISRKSLGIYHQYNRNA